MNSSGTKEPAALLPAREPSASTSEAAAAAGAKLRHAAILAAVLVVIGAVAGLLPRWLHRTALRAETGSWPSKPSAWCRRCRARPPSD